MTELLWTAGTFIAVFLIVVAFGFELIDILETRNNEGEKT